ncbi:MAG: 30S ribosomal protein S18 [Omnitrophica WOR_2 bacterium RIFCSPLOWO2_12_FULL_51_8]|nr:MAG: 30S ribosomal protein S18 [Omnitrophica WOR_2 bacterium RIFCSPLOWO2_12_FULL_51_8]
MKVKTRSTTRKLVRKKDTRLVPRKRFCRFCVDNVKTIDYKDIKRLENFITERGKILTSRISGNCAKHQRRITEAIKKARFVSLIPYKK